ncbi:MAG: hypothetical protein ACRD2R_07090 [Terriglobales bacterium]
MHTSRAWKRARTMQAWSLAGVLLAATCAWAAPAERGVLAREAVMYLSPDTTSQKLGTVGRGREVVILEKSKEWLHVFANVEQGKDVTGWILDKGVVRTSTPQGDRILYGEAVDSESEAVKRRGRRNAAEDAMRLYYRMAEYFPNSPLAGEALYRAADIKWQIDSRDAKSRPSAKERDPRYRPDIDETLMREVRKKFPDTKWSALAQFSLLDNKLCGDWEGRSKCPENESELYEKYAREFPQSPKAAEALYLAALRQSNLIEIYKTEGNPGKSQSARSKGTALAQQIVARFPESDWASRAIRLIYMMEQEIPTYGRSEE